MPSDPAPPKASHCPEPPIRDAFIPHSQFPWHARHHVRALTVVHSSHLSPFFVLLSPFFVLFFRSARPPHPHLSAQSRERLRLFPGDHHSRHRREGTPLGLAALELPAAVEKSGRTRPRSTWSPRVASFFTDATCCRSIVDFVARYRGPRRFFRPTHACRG